MQRQQESSPPAFPNSDHFQHASTPRPLLSRAQLIAPNPI